MRLLQNKGNDPWILGGDFNEILNDDEKKGGPRRCRNLLENFRQALDDCSLRDIQFIGDKFTW